MYGDENIQMTGVAISSTAPLPGDFEQPQISAHSEAQHRLTSQIDRLEKAAANLSERVQPLLLPSDPPSDIEAKLAQVEREGSDVTNGLRAEIDRISAACRRIEAVVHRIDL